SALSSPIHAFNITRRVNRVKCAFGTGVWSDGEGVHAIDASRRETCPAGQLARRGRGSARMEPMPQTTPLAMRVVNRADRLATPLITTGVNRLLPLVARAGHGFGHRVV